jgi:hypothetical protein
MRTLFKSPSYWLMLGVIAAISAFVGSINRERNFYRAETAAAHQNEQALYMVASDLETEVAAARLQSLPADAAKWHTSLILQPDWETRPAEKQAVQALNTEPHLKAFKAQTNFHLLKTDSPVYAKNFSAECPLTPCLLITRADGTVIYKESGSQLGKSPRRLYGAIQAEMKRHCPDGRCLPPLKFPDQSESEEPVREAIPDTVEPPKEPPISQEMGFLVILAVMVGTFVLVKMFENKKRFTQGAAGN